jgi:titin
VISGNKVNGVRLSNNGTTGNLVQGNFIGTDASGSVALGNDQVGVYIDGAPGNVVGGAAAGAGNVISANGGDGVNIAYFGTAAGNVIQGNLIGLNAAGTAALGNMGRGVFTNAPNTTIGGTTLGARNVISGNLTEGILINSRDAHDNLIQGNFIGTDSTGTARVPNGSFGVGIGDAVNNTIGGTDAAAGNLISGGARDGIGIGGIYNSGNQVLGNWIGLDANGDPLGNALTGVYIDAGGNNLVQGNVISANHAYGVALNTGTTGNQILGNLIGTDPTGLVGRGNSSSGIFIGNGSHDNTIGDTASGDWNTISANGLDGIFLTGNGTTGNRVQGNFIGVAADGATPLGNAANGVNIVAASGNTIGGTDSGAGNYIAFNGGDGVRVDTGTGNAIRQNSIFGHDAGLGIELVNGGNQNQPAPVLTSAVSGGGTTTVTGTLTSVPNTTYILEFFASPVANPSGFGEGLVFLGSLSVTTTAGGTANFTSTFTGDVSQGWFIAATATSPGNNTSAFSACVQVSGTGGAGTPGGGGLSSIFPGSTDRLTAGGAGTSMVADGAHLPAKVALWLMSVDRLGTADTPSTRLELLREDLGPLFADAEFWEFFGADHHRR